MQQFDDDSPIRLLTVDGAQYEGRYAGYDAGFVRIVADSSVTIPTARIAELFERRTYTRSWLGRGALIGATLAFGWIAYAETTSDDDDCPPDFCADIGYLAVPFTLTAAFGGATVGAIAGSYVRGWQPQRW